MWRMRSFWTDKHAFYFGSPLLFVQSSPRPHLVPSTFRSKLNFHFITTIRLISYNIPTNNNKKAHNISIPSSSCILYGQVRSTKFQGNNISSKLLIVRWLNFHFNAGWKLSDPFCPILPGVTINRLGENSSQIVFGHCCGIEWESVGARERESEGARERRSERGDEGGVAGKLMKSFNDVPLLSGEIWFTIR